MRRTGRRGYPLTSPDQVRKADDDAHARVDGVLDRVLPLTSADAAHAAAERLLSAKHDEEFRFFKKLGEDGRAQGERQIQALEELAKRADEINGMLRLGVAMVVGCLAAIAIVCAKK